MTWCLGLPKNNPVVVGGYGSVDETNSAEADGVESG